MIYRRLNVNLTQYCYATTGLNKIPDSVSDEQALFVGDILATGFWATRISEITEENTVLIIGAGPTGVCCLLCTLLKNPRNIIVCEKSKDRREFIQKHYPQVMVVEPEDCEAFVEQHSLMGSLLVGVSFAKGFARSLNIPMIDVNHLQGHVMAHFIKESDDDQSAPPFPFICLLVSGGNSQIVKVNAYNDMEVLGQTIDDAAGEAIDKCAKVLEWGYPGGPVVDKYARQGNPKAFSFSEPHIPGLNYSFSGFKTSFLYSLRKWVAADPDFVEKNKYDLAASIEFTIVDILMKKLRMAVKQTGIKHVAVAGGVSANNGLRNAFHDHAKRFGWTIYIPKFSYTTDNAAMIGCVGTFKYRDGEFATIDLPAYSKVTFK